MILALTGALPAIFLMWLIERFDSKRPEPRSTLRAVAVWGGLATIPCIILQELLQHLVPAHGVGGAFFEAFGQAALTEESAKAVVLYLVVWRHPAFDERLDGIVYATRAGLGFALVENVGYLFNSHGLAGFLGVFLLRAVLAVPGHAIYAGFMGYWAARRRFDNVGPGLFGGLLIAMMLHGTYDVSLFLCGVVGKDAPLLVLPLILVAVGVVGFGFLRLKAHANEALRLDDIAQPGRLKLPLGLGFVLR